MQIGILRTGNPSEQLIKKFGEYPDFFARLLEGHGFEFSAYAVDEMEFPDSVNAADGWLITGSACGVYESHPFIPPLEDFIREAYATGVPVIGICFGHQIIAQALGGKVEKFSGGWALGRKVYRTSAGDSLAINAIHQDQVVIKPAEAETILSNEFCANAGFLYKGPALSFQPHPEFSEEFMRELLLHKRQSSLAKENVEQVLQGLDSNIDSNVLAAHMADFFKANARRKVA